MNARIRVRNITSQTEINRTEVHNFRQHEELGFEIPANVKPDGEWRYFGGNSHEIWNEENSISSALHKHYKNLNIVPRKNSVIALEYVMSMSQDFFHQIKKNYDVSAVLDQGLKFILEKHKGHIISTAKHFDELTPHIHVIVAPVINKITKWDLNADEKKRAATKSHTFMVEPKSRLSARDFTGGKLKLSKLQMDFYNHMNTWTQMRFGLELTMHTPVEKQKKIYTEKTNHLLGEMDTTMKRLNRLAKEHQEDLNKLIAIKQKTKEEILKFKEKKKQLDRTALSSVANKDIKFHQKNLLESDKPLKEKKKGRGM